MAAFRMIVGFLLLAFTGLCARTSALEPAPLTSEQLAEGWINLFDGESLFGWKATTKADWKVDSGAITVGGGEPGLLCTTSQWADYELKLDFKAEPGTNSGIFMRTSPKPKNTASDCYELNIAPADNPFPTGSIVSRKKSEQAGKDGDRLDKRWHTYHVRAEGGRWKVKLDGADVLDYTDNRPLGRGFIGLQLNQGKVAFKNIKLRPLATKSMFNGKDLSGWQVNNAGDTGKKKTRFSVTPKGEIRMRDGPGQLETTGRWADFVMQMEVFVRGKELNSGVFFRSIPGEYQNGYESQIHNGFAPGDRSKPTNYGTGGIFRRQQARRVPANDSEWFSKTILCQGDRMAVWVNGIQVSDWRDTRQPHNNPRQGRRLKAGSIILQGHDPTTDLLFRKLRIAELAPRRPKQD